MRPAFVLAAFLVLVGVVSAAQEPPRTFRVPFHIAGGMILLDAKVNDKPAVLLLDTGADFTLVSPQASGLATVKLHALMANRTTGANGEYVKGRVDLHLDKRHWIARSILVMDLSEASKRLGTRIDGFIGADLLEEFSAVRIDYKKHFVELEE
jgi:predicted aspartyl protease